MHGRKGPKADPTIAGTTVTHLAQNCPNPLLIIKDPRIRASKTNAQYHFGVCYDSSNKSRQALRVVLGMMRPEDKLTCITCKEMNIKMDQITSQVNSICSEFNYTTQCFKVVEREAGQNVYKAIQQYLIFESNADNYVDFVAVGNAGVNWQKSKSTLGSVANMVVRAKRMNVIFCP